MPFCESCGTNLSEGQRFCPNCGASIQDTYPVDLKVSGGKQAPRISATSKTPIGILIFAIVSIIWEILNSRSLFRMIGGASQLYRIYPGQV